ncbi:receptor-like protein EIX2 [Gossypium hirsutum]|uniref:Receptor-like protein EIX2 n=1 Tax=Gossypium hirsutum TaxID=3635 RepID=A0A1U8P5X9_GOSHI|nr:receptor-like protein EIX2 [Gossypium hirsutum]
MRMLLCLSGFEYARFSPCIDAAYAIREALSWLKALLFDNVVIGSNCLAVMTAWTPPIIDASEIVVSHGNCNHDYSSSISFFPFLLLIPAICFSICHANSNLLCIQSEREALLKFKNHLIDPSKRLSSWVEGGDCCKWIGVVCHNSTGYVNQLHLAAPPLSQPDFDAPLAEWEAYVRSKLQGKINPSLLELKHLSSLDLSSNNFSSIHIPKIFGLLESLTYLNLSYAQFQGAIPHNLGNLSKLQYFDLGGNDLKSKSLQWVSGLSSLQYLDLSYADLHKANDWVQVTFKLPSLLELHLPGCDLEDVPSSISVNSSKSLVVLDLSGNFLSSVPKWIFSLYGLVSIYLSENSLEGPIPDYSGNISFLEVLDLSGWNHLNSSIPNSLYSLNRLQFLSLSGNQLQGTISSAIGNLSSVTHLYLSENQLNGQIPLSIGELSSLKLFDVSKNQLNGQIPLSIRQLSSLKLFDVSENQLHGTFPLSIGELSSLEYLGFGYNLLGGVVLETHFSNLMRLITLAASHNRLRFEPNSSWIPSFQCEWIELGDWYLGPKFPQWLKFQKKLSYLDISNAGILDVMPTWFLNLPTPFEYLNLSFNQLTGGISYLNVRDTVDLSSNRLTGPFPRVLSTLRFLFLSNNSFSGSLSQLLCDSSSGKRMEVLYIDKNLISGDIPDCWSHCQDLNILNLGSNNLTGKIPPSLGLIYARAQQAETQGSNLPKQAHYSKAQQSLPLLLLFLCNCSIKQTELKGKGSTFCFDGLASEPHPRRRWIQTKRGISSLFLLVLWLRRLSLRGRFKKRRQMGRSRVTPATGLGGGDGGLGLGAVAERENQRVSLFFLKTM